MGLRKLINKAWKELYVLVANEASRDHEKATGQLCDPNSFKLTVERMALWLSYDWLRGNYGDILTDIANEYCKAHKTPYQLYKLMVLHTKTKHIDALGGRKGIGKQSRRIMRERTREALYEQGKAHFTKYEETD